MLESVGAFSPRYSIALAGRETAGVRRPASGIAASIPRNPLRSISTSKAISIPPPPPHRPVFTARHPPISQILAPQPPHHGDFRVEEVQGGPKTRTGGIRGV